MNADELIYINKNILGRNIEACQLITHNPFKKSIFKQGEKIIAALLKENKQISKQDYRRYLQTCIKLILRTGLAAGYYQRTDQLEAYEALNQEGLEMPPPQLAKLQEDENYQQDERIIYNNLIVFASGMEKDISKGCRKIMKELAPVLFKYGLCKYETMTADREQRWS